MIAIHFGSRKQRQKAKNAVNTDFLPSRYIDTPFKSKYRKNRLNEYVRWLDETKQDWFNPNLSRYVAYLNSQSQLQPSTRQAKLSAVQSRYRELVNHPTFRDYLMAKLPENISIEFIGRYQDKMHDAAYSKEIAISYKTTSRSSTELTKGQVETLLNTPKLEYIRGKRDTAIIATFLFTGLRETETRLLSVEDIRQNNETGETEIHVPEGPASNERDVIVPGNFPLYPILETWMKAANIQTGPLFRGFHKGEKRLRDGAITLQGIEDVFKLYPVQIEGRATLVRPFDLRRYYAQMLRSIDYELDIIADNMGIRRETVVNYIGTASRSEKGIPTFDLKRLAT